MSLLLPAPDTLSDESVLAHYSDVLAQTDGAQGVVEVRLNADGKGKGVYALKDIDEGETLFTECPLASIQHVDNKASALVCQRCLRYLGSVERQIGHKLRHLVASLRGTQGATGGGAAGGGGADGGSDGAGGSSGAGGGGGSDPAAAGGSGAAGGAAASGSGSASASASGGGKGGAAGGAAGAEGEGDGAEAEEGRSGSVDLEEALAAGERLAQIYAHVTPERIEELRAGAAAPLPLSCDFALPAEFPCRRGCGELYCGAECEAAAWEHSHSLLCTAPAPSAAAAQPASSEQGRPHAQAEGEGAEVLHGVHVDRAALAAFAEHARATNEIFLLAAQVLVSTLLRAAKLLESASGPAAASAASAPAADAAAAAGGAAAAAAGGASAAPAGSGGDGSGPAGGDGSGEEAVRCGAALAAAWRPYVHAWKRCWWDAVAVPDDVEDEDEFRQQLRSLASDSLALLAAAISDARFTPHLFQLQVYGSVVGMFELNNLGVSVPSPVEDFFLAADEMDEGADKEAVLAVTQPLLDALDSEYATPCEGTAFLALQSCCNHSCDPNAVAICDSGDRTTSVMAQRAIRAGHEVTLSYIDVSLPYKQRQAELRDYGFVCRCPRCVEDASKARARGRAGQAAKGVKLGRRR